MADQPPTMPPFVYVPTSPGTRAERRVILHTMPDGRVALYAYSAIDRLQTYYRADAHWVGCDIEMLQRLYDQTPYDLLLLDVDPGPVARGEGASV